MALCIVWVPSYEYHGVGAMHRLVSCAIVWLHWLMKHKHTSPCTSMCIQYTVLGIISCDSRAGWTASSRHCVSISVSISCSLPYGGKPKASMGPY